jgi:predicted regulator of Ras-like GTPase activity (Roadblock/LC7/MglB family)
MESGAITNLDRIRDYGQRLQRDPNPLSHALLAEAFREEGMLAEAEDACRQGLASYPGYVTTRIILGQVLEAREDVAGAQREFEIALGQDPANMIARTALGRILIQQGRMGEAAQHLEHVLFLNPADVSARELLDVAQGRQELPAPEKVEVFEPPAAEYPGEAMAPTAAVADLVAMDALAPVGSADVQGVLASLTGLEGVLGVMLLAEEGVPVTSTLGTGVSEELFAALVAEMWQTADKYMQKMSLGGLRRGTIDGSEGMMIVIGMGANALVIATEPGARLGLINFQAERARELLERL